MIQSALLNSAVSSASAGAMAGTPGVGAVSVGTALQSNETAPIDQQATNELALQIQRRGIAEGETAQMMSRSVVSGARGWAQRVYGGDEFDRAQRSYERVTKKAHLINVPRLAVYHFEDMCTALRHLSGCYQIAISTSLISRINDQ